MSQRESAASRDRRSLRVAFIGGRGVVGRYSGIETYYEEVGSRLAERGHRVTAYCRRRFTPDIPSHRGILVRRLPALRGKHLETLTHSLLSTFDALWRAFDVVQYHAIGSAPLAVLPRLRGVATVASVRGLDWQRAKWGAIARLALRLGEWASARCPTATVVVSTTLRDHYASHHRCRAVCIPNAVVPGRHRPIDRSAAYGLTERGFLLFAGRLSPEKGVHTLLEALAPLRPAMPLVLAGGGSYSDAYQDQVRKLAWDGVRFLGSVDRDTMLELLSNCYAFVLPSEMEGLSIALLESLSYGNCILTTAIPENLEVVGEAALTFPPGDVEALRTALARILQDSSTVAEYRQRATARAATLPDWDEVARQTEALYRDLVGTDRRARLTSSRSRA